MPRVRGEFPEIIVATVPFQTSTVAVELKPSPIEPSWVVAGNPVARASELMRSSDKSTWTVVWDCTAGSFEWIYNCDETIHIMEGSIVLKDDHSGPTRLGPGDVVFFPKGSRVHWEVEGYVKKVAFLRNVIPNPMTIPYKVARRLKAMLRGGRPSPAGGFGASPI